MATPSNFHYDTTAMSITNYGKSDGLMDLYMGTSRSNHDFNRFFWSHNHAEQPVHFT